MLFPAPRTKHIKRWKIIHRIFDLIHFPSPARPVLYNPTPLLPEEGSPRMTQTAAESVPAPDYGLRREILSPMETLAQSISTIAPTATPVAAIPLVCALAGNGTWLAYALATVAVVLVALCIG